MDYFAGKTILVTGGTGSIGSQIARALGNSGAKAIRILSNDENGIYTLSNELDNPAYRFLVGDVRERERMFMACENVDIVFHAAAMKHVPLCEYNPYEAMKTNVTGTQKIIDACLAHNVEKLIFISTDKAVEPINTMGASKLLAEKLVIDANFYKGLKPTAFSIVRFGNVMASRGSVIPLFVEQARNGGPMTLTSPDMTRFMMFIHEAVQLIFQAASTAKGGEIFSFEMPVVKMLDLAEVIRDEVAQRAGKTHTDIQINTIGIRPGERLHEALMTEEEAARAGKLGNLLVIPPPQPDIPSRTWTDQYTDLEKIDDIYKSDKIPPLSKEQIRELLLELNVF